MKSYDCLELLASWMDEYMITVTSIRGASREWSHLWKGPSTSGTMGQCVPLALGLSLAFPRRKVIALDSDGGALFSTTALSTVANVNPPNLMIIVFDNELYGWMGPSHTGGVSDLAKIAQGAGIKTTGSIRDLETFASQVKKAMDTWELSYFVAKVEPGWDVERVGESIREYYSGGGSRKQSFKQAIERHPDYRGKRASDAHLLHPDFKRS